MKQSLILASAALAAVMSAPALAQAPQQAAFTFSVERNGLTETRAETAYERLQAEAERYCASIELTSRHAQAVCERDVVDTVVARIDDPTLNAQHADALRAGSSYAQLDPR